MELNLRAFTDDEVRLVHDRTVEILRDVGISVKSEIARDILLGGGASLTRDDIISISENMITDALAKAPKEYVLGARNPAYDFHMPASMPAYGVDGIAPTVLDIDTGQVRDSLKSDVCNIGRVFQKLNMGAVAWTGCSALDMPPETHSLHEFAAMIKGTSKHVQFELRDKGEAKYAIEILKTILGSEAAVIERKIASVLFCPISPLQLDDSMLDAYLVLARYEVPVNVYPCPILGLTCPASVFSAVTQINAEVIASLVLFQLLQPGIPIMYGSCSGNADKNTADYFYGDESSLVSAGSIEMSRFYKLPSYVAGGGFEDFPNAIMRPDLADGFGTLDNGMIFDMELMVIQNEIANRVWRQVKGIEVSAKTDLTEDIKAVGPGGSFLSRKSTRKMYRDTDELYSSKLFSDTLRTTYTEMADMRSIANSYIREILAGPVEDELPSGVLSEIDRICGLADEELSGKH